MNGGNLYDPGLHLFVDDEEVQDHPGFVRKVQRPARLQAEPVLSPDRPWEGKAVQLWGSVLFDDEEGLFKMWYYSVHEELYNRTGSGHFMCYATSRDGVEWEKPELGIVPCAGSRANNIVYPTPDMGDLGGDPWGVLKDVNEEDPSKRYKMGIYQQHLTEDAPRFDESGMTVEERNQARKILLEKIKDHHGMYSLSSADGIHWKQGEDICVPRGGDGGTLVHDPMQGRYIATTRRYGTVLDHFVVEWKKYRRVIAMSTSTDFVDWTPLKTALKPDDFDDPMDQFYVMTPFVYGNQYLGFLGVLQSVAELGPTQLVAARDLDHWRRVGRREEFMPVGSPGSWDCAWSTFSANPPVLRGDTLYMWYSGRPQAHGTQGMFESFIGVATLRKDGFVALRCGIRGGEVMTEPILVTGPRLYLNAAAPFAQVLVRVIDDMEEAPGFSFEACNGLVRGDEVSREITWGEERRDLSRFAGRRIRLHIRSDNAASLYSYRMGEED